MRRAIAIVSIAGSLACAPTAKVQVEAPQPIVIQLDIKHEVRLRIENDLGELVEQEDARASVSTRGGDLGDEARVREGLRTGAVRETAAGYVAAEGVEPELAAAVARVNETRRSAYETLAERHGVDRSDVEALAASLRTR